MSKASRIRRERESVDAEPEATTRPAFDGPAWQEFSDRLNQLAAAHWFAAHGLGPLGQELVQFAQQSGGRADTFHIMPAPPWDESLVPNYSEIPFKDIPTLLGPGGAFEALVGHLWVVTVYTEWEEHYRERIASDLGMTCKKDLKSPVFGDLRRFRNDIVHHRGIAKADESGKVEVFTDWTTVGQPMMIAEHKIAAFMDKVGLVKRRSQNTAEGFEAATNMVNTERQRLGVDKLLMLRGDGTAGDRSDIVQCAVCRQRSRTDAANCPHCGAGLPAR